jgi:hypothetical protein
VEALARTTEVSRVLNDLVELTVTVRTPLLKLNTGIITLFVSRLLVLRSVAPAMLRHTPS